MVVRVAVGWAVATVAVAVKIAGKDVPVAGAGFIAIKVGVVGGRIGVGAAGTSASHAVRKRSKVESKKISRLIKGKGDPCGRPQ